MLAVQRVTIGAFCDVGGGAGNLDQRPAPSRIPACHRLKMIFGSVRSTVTDSGLNWRAETAT